MSVGSLILLILLIYLVTSIVSFTTTIIIGKCVRVPHKDTFKQRLKEVDKFGKKGSLLNLILFFILLPYLCLYTALTMEKVNRKEIR